MAEYRNLLTENYNEDIGSIVGCGLDRMASLFNWDEIIHAVNFYETYRHKINTFPIGARRALIAEYMNTRKMPRVLQNKCAS